MGQVAVGSDMGGLVTQIGVGLTFALLVFREVLTFFKGTKGTDTLKQTGDLHDALKSLPVAPSEFVKKLDAVHGVVIDKDADGVPRVFQSRGHADMIAKLADIQAQQTMILSKLVDNVTDLKSMSSEIRDTVKLLEARGGQR
tara:strand:+ start:110 stop:535 length:426 start_codon:yes stop_codon:yes gene_type:complete